MNIKDIYNQIISDFDSPSEKIKVDLIYAFNGTGKTRISRMFAENYDKSLCFNSLFQDEFTWDNNQHILKVNEYSWIVRLIDEQGFQKEIIDNFHNLYNGSIEPLFNPSSTKVTFNVRTEDGFDTNIKISKAEETLFIWSVFLTVMNFAFSELSQPEDERSTSIFNNLRYIVIDDPVSSIDDGVIIRVALMIIDFIRNSIEKKDIKLSFLITTHHALFCNVVFNSIKNIKGVNDRFYILKKDNYLYKLEKQRNDNVFGYQLVLITCIKDAINTKKINKTNFNMFRILLEKTANFFGYNNGYNECIPDFKHKKELLELINQYSHGKLSEYESLELRPEEVQIFEEGFNRFVEKYNWRDYSE